MICCFLRTKQYREELAKWRQKSQEQLLKWKVDVKAYYLAKFEAERRRIQSEATERIDHSREEQHEAQLSKLKDDGAGARILYNAEISSLKDRIDRLRSSDEEKKQEFVKLKRDVYDSQRAREEANASYDRLKVKYADLAETHTLKQREAEALAREVVTWKGEVESARKQLHETLELHKKELADKEGVSI